MKPKMIQYKSKFEENNMKKKLKLMGQFRNTERGYGFVELEGREDVFIAPKMCKDALNGDTVTIAILNEGGNRKKTRRKDFESCSKS